MNFRERGALTLIAARTGGRRLRDIALPPYGEVAMHALIIEDEALIAVLIDDYLRDLGYTSIDLATTEAEALAYAEVRCPDLITSDVRLAPGCGIAAVQAICSSRQIPVVFVTATGWEVHERLKGAVVVAKPFTAADLCRAVSLAQGISRGK